MNNVTAMRFYRSGQPEVPRVPWEHFISRHFQWKQGEHIGIIGPTGNGKTTLALNLLPLRRFVTIFATKPRDEVMDMLRDNGYKVYREWKPESVTMYPKRILWPHATSLYSDDNQKAAFQKAFERIYLEGGWCLYLDEMWYMVNQLKFQREIKTYLLQARSLGISLVQSAQRPAWVPVETFDQSTHLFFYRDNDERNLRKIAGIGSLSADLIQYTVARLNKDAYETLYINTRSNDMFVTSAPMVG